MLLSCRAGHYSKSLISVVIMMKITLLLGFGLVVINLCVVNAQLPCDSFLRVVRPELFTHCSSCFYNSWSSWTRTGRPMSNSGCPTKRSFTETEEPEQIARANVKRKNKTGLPVSSHVLPIQLINR